MKSLIFFWTLTIGADIGDKLAGRHRPITMSELAGWEVSPPVFKGRILRAALQSYEGAVNNKQTKYHPIDNNCQVYVKYLIRSITRQQIPMTTTRIFSANRLLAF